MRRHGRVDDDRSAGTNGDLPAGAERVLELRARFAIDLHRGALKCRRSFLVLSRVEDHERVVVAGVPTATLEREDAGIFLVPAALGGPDYADGAFAEGSALLADLCQLLNVFEGAVVFGKASRPKVFTIGGIIASGELLLRPVIETRNSLRRKVEGQGVGQALLRAREQEARHIVVVDEVDWNVAWRDANAELCWL